MQTLARGQAELGCQVSVLCVNHADRFGNDITHARLRKTVSTWDKDGAVHVERLGRWFGVSRLELCPSLPWRIRQLTAQADIVHLHTPNPLMLAGWWLAGNRKVPMVVTHHSDVIKQRLLRYAVAPFESSVYGKAKLIFSDSPTYGQGSPALQRHEDKVSILPLGIDLQPFGIMDTDLSPNAEIPTATPGCPLWLMVGRMTYYKGYQIALEALAKVPGTLLIVGNGPLEAELKAQAERWGVAERIVWKSHASPKELIALYHAATALWFPSIARSEGFGLVQVEAMAAGWLDCSTHSISKPSALKKPSCSASNKGKWLNEVRSSKTKVKRDLSGLAKAAKGDIDKQAANAEQPISHWRRWLKGRSVKRESVMLRA